MSGEPCRVSDHGCLAPAGLGLPGYGYASGDRAARCTCSACGESVCSSCSSRVRRGGGRVRICQCCLDDEEADRSRRSAATHENRRT